MGLKELAATEKGLIEKTTGKLVKIIGNQEGTRTIKIEHDIERRVYNLETYILKCHTEDKSLKTTNGYFRISDEKGKFPRQVKVQFVSYEVM